MKDVMNHDQVPKYVQDQLDKANAALYATGATQVQLAVQTGRAAVGLHRLLIGDEDTPGYEGQHITLHAEVDPRRHK